MKKQDLVNLGTQVANELDVKFEQDSFSVRSFDYVRFSYGSANTLNLEFVPKGEKNGKPILDMNGSHFSHKEFESRCLGFIRGHEYARRNK